MLIMTAHFPHFVAYLLRGIRAVRLRLLKDRTLSREVNFGPVCPTVSAEREESMLEVYLSQLELAYFELGEAFKGLKDENVWKRPGEGLLSVGEIAGHVAH
jgi:hypothetical protein